MLEVIHISDTHFGPDRSETIRWANTYDRSVALVAAINALPFTPDFIVHTGDVVNDPDPEAYRLAAEVLSGLKVPLYYAAGNHDDVAMMREALAFGAHRLLVPESDASLCYRLSGGKNEEIEFFVVDARVPQEEGPHGFFPRTGSMLSSPRSRGKSPSPFFFIIPSARSARPGSTGISSSRTVVSFSRRSPPKQGLSFAESFRGISIAVFSSIAAECSSQGCRVPPANLPRVPTTTSVTSFPAAPFLLITSLSLPRRRW